MTGELMLAFAGFAFVASITPGPNNAMLLASGVHFGFRRTVPHMIGISFGCVVMLVLVGFGLGQVFTAVPALYTALRWAGAAYLLWLAWAIARSGPADERPAGPRPFGFWPAAFFQWVNPKAWIMVVGAVSTYAPPDGFAGSVAVLAALMTLACLPSTAVWAAFGAALRPFLADPRRMRVFNIAMAVLLVLSLIPVVAT
ncbi:protein AmbA [Allostella sp. ATCC 35155]|nr:protein AmbA [Stella sp. ATCC 35155]